MSLLRMLSHCYVEMASKQCMHNQIAIRGMKRWKENTLRLMYHRSRLFNAVKQPPRHRSVRQEWNYKAEMFAFSQRLSEQFSENGLRTAFTHRSYITKEEKIRKNLGVEDVAFEMEHNSKLINEGQVIITNYIKPYLRHFLPKLPEDGIRAIHDYLLTDDVLGDVAKWIGCIDLILCEEFPPNLSTLANTVKALVGVLANDVNEKHAQNFVIDFILTYLDDKDMLEIWDIPNASINLKRILKRERLPPPEPRLLRETGVGTVQPCYVVGLYVNKQLIGSGPGETIEIAESMAEYDALRRMFNASTSATMFTFGPKAYDLDLSKSTRESLYLKDWAPSLLNDGKAQLLTAFN